ncbi:hypothetical protein ACIQMR_04715 [Streptomyces sp. NPDC091376]|uniref:hypothetical protein n=1 Tax=Streptomyces sp. NPDC091376 TaxID=3365994 RepID=UPI00380F49CF
MSTGEGAAMAVLGRRIRFTAVLVGVVLALTGFSSSGGSYAKSSGHDRGGGGCSSSKSGTTNTDDVNDNSGTTGGGSGGSKSTPTPSPTALPAHVELISCAGPGRPKATIKVTSHSTVERNVRTSITFEWEGYGVEHHMIEVKLKAGASQMMDIDMKRADKAGVVERCALGPIETP